MQSGYTDKLERCSLRAKGVGSNRDGGQEQQLWEDKSRPLHRAEGNRNKSKCPFLQAFLVDRQDTASGH